MANFTSNTHGYIKLHLSLYNDLQNLDIIVKTFQRIYNSRTHERTKFTPNKIVFVYSLNTNINHLLELPTEQDLRTLSGTMNYYEYYKVLRSFKLAINQKVIQNQIHYYQQLRKNYEKRNKYKPAYKLKIGQPVLYIKKPHTNKIQLPNRKFYVIHKINTRNTYDILDKDENQIKKNIHMAKLIPYHYQ